MKKSTLSRLSIITLSLSLFPLVSMQAEHSRFYLKGDVGGTSASDIKLRAFFGEPTLAPNSEISLDPGIRIGLHAGYHLTEWFAAEIDTAVSANNIDTITGATEAEGSVANVPLLLNAIFHLPDHYRVSPYIGAGVGVASTILSGDDIVIGSTRFDGTTAAAAFACQGFAGVRFAINDRMGLSAEYRFLYTGPSDATADLTVGTTSDHVKLGRTQTHSVSVAFDFQF